MVRVKSIKSPGCGASDTLAEGPEVDAFSAVLDAPHSAAGARSEMREALDTMLASLVEYGGSDLHLTVDAPPKANVLGDPTTAKVFTDVINAVSGAVIDTCSGCRTVRD